MKIFIGYDSTEPQAFTTLAHSLYTRATEPISIHPLTRKSLGPLYTRPRGATESTEFSLTRFLVPYLCHYDNELVVYMDCDMLCKVDILTLLNECDPDGALHCVKHDYLPKQGAKMDGLMQTTYPKKNWSSFMVFNPSQCQILTPDYVHGATGLQLHQFHWIAEDAILPLFPVWNWLVEEYPRNDQAKILHYTLGGPWLHPYRTTDHADDWFNEHKEIC